MRADASILEAYLERTARSAALAARARRVLPGGIVTDTRYFEPYGLYVDRGSGTRKYDVDGNEYIDLFGGHGANMLGHAPPVMVEAVRAAVSEGVQFAANTPSEVALAELVLRLVPSAERLRFTGSGTEATLLALRIARAFTGRSKIVRFAAHYHGWHDHAASGYVAPFEGSPAPGILPEIASETILLRAGDTDALRRAVERHGRAIAAFIIEPVGCHFGIVPVAATFLHEVQRAAREAGALFILDEVLSGFRASMGGAQAVYGLEPDLTTLAKVLCGGMPGGAVAGRGDILDILDFDPARRGDRSKVLHQGTFTANPVSMAAGLAVLQELERIDGCARANALGRYARDRLNDVSEAEKLPFAWYGDFSIFHLFVREDGGCGAEGMDWGAIGMEAYLARPQPLINRLRMALNILGIDVNTRCSGLVSAVHLEEDIEALSAALAQAGQWLNREKLL